MARMQLHAQLGKLIRPRRYLKKLDKRNEVRRGLNLSIVSQPILPKAGCTPVDRV